MGNHISYKRWPATIHKRTLLLITIFILTFLFRVTIILHNEYPPSSDIGLHSSILNLILDEGKLPLQNPYHMGGEPLVTPPGFHFFTSTLILFTGMPLLLAQLLTAAFFSSFIVFPAYLISKRVWKSPSAGILAAFFSAVSALSLEMISWGGYTNIISIALIVMILHVFLREIDQPNHFNLLTGTMFFSSVILSHTFSLFVFFPILIIYFASLLVGKAAKLKQIELLKALRFFTISVTLGILVVSPWLLRVFNFYISASSEGALLGGMETNRNLILQNRSVNSIILALVIAIIPALFMFRASRKRWFDNGSLLILAWFLVPVIMTQAHIFGIFVDYSRFLYFIDFPGILIVSAALFYLFRYILIAFRKISGIKWSFAKKIVPALFTAILFNFFVLSPWSIFPSEAMQRVDYYSTIKRPEATALEWIQNRTPESSVLVADHLYGWWLSGVGKRTTLSAAGLEFLLYSHEIEVARSAQLLFDTNYYITNGLIQVREDGPQFLRRNPEFSLETWNGESHPLFYLQDNETLFVYEWINSYGQTLTENTTLAEMETVEEYALTKDENAANLIVIFENDFFTVKKIVTVQQGVRYAEISYEIEIKRFRTNLFHIFLRIFTWENNEMRNQSTTMFEMYDPFQRIYKQVIFEGDIPVEINEKRDDPRQVEMLYRYPWERNINIKMLVGGSFDAQDLSYPNDVKETYDELASSPMENVILDPLFIWDYIEMIEKYDVSYVVCREQNVYSKFSEDPKFRLVFKGGNVGVFQVVK